MSAMRTQIREALAAALTGLPTCGAHVFATRGARLGKSDLPAIVVSAGGEDFGATLMATGKPVERQMTLYVDVVVALNVGFEDQADAAEAEIEGALFDTVAHATLGGLVHGITLASIGNPEIDDSTDPAVVRLPLVFQALYS